MPLPITLTLAGACALINLWLGLRCTRLRYATRTDQGDGGHPRMLARMRAHANFVEYTPLVVILVGLIEYSKGSAGWLWGASLVYLVGRLLHPFGMERPAPNPLRACGILATWIVLGGLALYAIWLASLMRGA